MRIEIIKIILVEILLLIIGHHGNNNSLSGGIKIRIISAKNIATKTEESIDQLHP